MNFVFQVLAYSTSGPAVGNVSPDRTTGWTGRHAIWTSWRQPPAWRPRARDKWHRLDNTRRGVLSADSPGIASARDRSTVEEARQETGQGALAGNRAAAGGTHQAVVASQTEYNYPTLLPPMEHSFFPRGVDCSCQSCASHLAATISPH